MVLRRIHLYHQRQKVRGNRWTDGNRCQGTHTVRCAEMGTTTRSGGGARAPSASTAPYAAAQATPPPLPTRATSEARAAGLWGDALWAHAARRTG